MIQSLERAFRILELLDTLECGQSGMGGYEISKRLGMKYPTAHNFLKSLSALGYIEQDSVSGKYLLSRKMQDLGYYRFGQQSLLLCAQPHLRKLTAEIGEASLLVLLDHDCRHTVLVEHTDKPFRLAVATGMDQNFYNTSTGRVLLANLDEAAYRQFKVRVPIVFSGKHIPASAAEMDAIIHAVRERGYECLEKAEGNITVIGVSLACPATGLNAAIGTFFHYRSKTAEEIAAIIAAMQKTSTTLTRILGIH